jgi:protein SCO1/2
MMKHQTFVLALALAACGDPHAAHHHPASDDQPHAGHDRAHHDHAAHHAAHQADQADQAAAPALDGESIFHLDEELALVDQAGAPFTLRSLEGRPTLITFFYGGCTTMCPLIVADVRRAMQAMPEAERAGVNVVLVTIDPERDTPERLRELALERDMPAEWRQVGGDAASIRALASTLGMTYRRLEDGSYAHAALYSALDGGGRVAHQLNGLGQPVEPLVLALRPRRS